MKNLIAIALLFIGAFTANAQVMFPNQKSAAEFVKRDLLVAGDEIFQEAVKEQWKLKQNMQFVSYDKGAELMKANPEKYAMVSNAKYSSYSAGGTSTKGTYYAFNAYISNPKGQIQQIFTAVFYAEPNPVTIGMAIRMFNTFLPNIAADKDPFDAESDVAKLSKKTLLLYEGQLDKDLTLAEASEIYGGKIEIVSTNKIMEAIENKDPKFAFVYAMHSTKTNFTNYVAVDTENLDVLAMVNIGGVGVGFHHVVGDTKYSHVWMLDSGGLAKKHLKYFLGTGAQKLNRKG
ncbi:hypothetical protein BH09BAC1_BH09BAC1_16960 [soil metagenome]